MPSNFLFVWLIGSFATYYSVEVLLWNHKVSHHGPWPSKNKQVIEMTRRTEDGGEQYTAPVTVFDWIRRVFGMYEIISYMDDKGNPAEFWYVKKGRAEVWECPKCLSWWVALFWSSVLCVAFGLPVLYTASFVGVAGTGLLLYWFADYLKESVIEGQAYELVSYREDDDSDEEDVNESRP